MKLCPIIFSIIVINWELINAAHTTDFALSEPELDTKNEATQIQNGTENEIKLLGDNFAFSLNLQVIENIVKKIENEKCVRDIRISLNSLVEGEVWALKMFDSLPKFPSGLLDGNLFVMGNFHECVETEWRQSNSTFSGQYCLAEVYFKLYKDNGGLFRMDPNLSQHVRMRFNSSVVHWGMCAPSSCTPTDVKVFVEETFSIVDSFESLRANVNDKNCYARRETRITNGEIIYASLIGLVFLFAIMSTTVHYWQIHRRKRSAVYNIDGLRREISTANEIILCFSIIRVVRSLLRTKPNEFNLECICGIKFLSMMLIIAGHSLIFILGGPISNIKFISKEYTDPLNGVLVNPLLVDTFLLVSGFLMCRLLLAELDKRNGKINIFVLYITRYVRLTPAYLVILGFYLTWMSRLAEGPLWNKTIVTEKEKCQQSWWTNLLYVNNYIKTDSLCMFQSWYLAADYHLFVLSPCIIFPLWRWRKVGKLLLAIIMLASISLPFYITYIGNLDPTLLAFPPEIQDISSNKYFLTAYVKTHMRASSYCFGLLLGYIVYRIQSAETIVTGPKFPIL
ncbi:nose resistant to fluoxetine protein 6-like isoform X2 [Cylas formicarius]|uniref:nose resistant to fluoxetine protein 6-like isoform X2 n=1 Tax=Cylas formicarius TaxID=197179 RepID=UPI0029583A87|nr:nose resistant to fluoxetine protein 6-like isoform X2 [Cylas formicarius]